MNFSKKFIIYFFIFIIITIFGYKLMPKSEIIVLEDNNKSGESANYIYVHIEGAVANPRYQTS